MKYYFSYIRVLFIVAIFLFTRDLSSQVRTRNNEYNPEQGQEGKDVRWFPTPQELVDKMLDMAKITSSDFLVDLGSGDGRTVISAAKRGVHSIGIEFNPDLVTLSRKNAADEGVSDKAEFIKADLFSYDFSKATVVTMFLLPEINLRLRPKLLEMKPGTRVVSTTFTMQNWQYDEVVRIDDKTSKWTTAFLWIVPAKMAGTWEFNGRELKLNQQFQMVTGELTLGGKNFKITGGKVTGTDLTFIAGGIRYYCNLKENKLEIKATENGKSHIWTAIKQK
ncbi:MAG: class I SAM-dependent methyltransferase [Bacteroidales bacterium]|nr:class I SAM-dependent methyltransferase [Bacteroidales bacterium]